MSNSPVNGQQPKEAGKAGIEQPVVCVFCGPPGVRPLRFMLVQNQFAKIDFHRPLTVDR
jgi:hypothetical protein